MNEKNKLFLLNPNLGQPELINLQEEDSKSKEKKYDVIFYAIFLSKIKISEEELKKTLLNSTYIQPILKERGNFAERRGELYEIELQTISIVNKNAFNMSSNDKINIIINDIYKTLLKIKKGILNEETLFVVKFKINQLQKIENLLEDLGRGCLLFDIIIKNENSGCHIINYHSLTIFKKEFDNFNFIHATDLHIARRNDFISKHVSNKAKKLTKEDSKEERNEKYLSILERDFILKEDFQEEKLDLLKFAKYNFNYNLRKFIEFANEKFIANELDFIVFTGDLIDYIEIAMGNDQYKDNYEVFILILLGKEKKKDVPPYLIEDEYLNKQEILIPIFTTMGNHDYRIGHYSLYAGKVRGIFGLTKEDIKGYHDLKFFSYYNIIRSGAKYIESYFHNINANRNYFFYFGNYFFICLDTGQDSKKNIYNLFRGSPKSKGLSDYQINFLKKAIELSKNRKIIILMHSPPLSPERNYYKKKKLKKKLDLVRNIKWSDLYENNLKSKIGKGELNEQIRLDHQTIKKNRIEFLNICAGCFKKRAKKVELILCGHNHTLKEFRLKCLPNENNSKSNEDISSVKIFTEKYRELINQLKENTKIKSFFEEKSPFMLQTQALGPISRNYLKFKPPGFRFLRIKSNQVIKIHIFSFHIDI